MTIERFRQIRDTALQVSKQMKRYGWVRRNTMARVSLAEHKWLCEHKPGTARFTRCFEYQHNDYVQDVDRPSQSRTPIIREVWVGSRSQALTDVSHEIEESTGEDMPAGFKKSQEIQEDAAELTELMALTYDDPIAFEQWLLLEKAKRFQELVAMKPRLRKHRARLLLIIEQVIRKEHPLPLMIEDEFGEKRPIRPGDVITTARGSNDDLDALFLEEADDPREQNDFSADGSDHRYSDRYRANTDLEEEFLQSREHRIPNSAMPEGTRYAPDDMQIRRVAQTRACDIILKNPELSDRILQLADEIEANLRRGIADIRFDQEGKLVAGYFVDRSEFFASMEQNFLNRKPKTQTPCTLTLASGRKVTGFRSAKAAPLALDWNAIRASDARSGDHPGVEIITARNKVTVVSGCEVPA